jgi:UDP-N-acetylmuramate: L-alanyl-gamma-D-glutamyl-meso-diaminopimelate ligase
MKIYFMGICGTAMGNAALLAREAGHVVLGADTGVYPPMSTVLAEAGIELHEGYDSARLERLAPDVVVIGNAMSRGNPELEWLLDFRKIPFVSLPAMLNEFVMRTRRNIVVCGTHGKTTTTSLTAFLLRENGRDPGFLIGGVPIDPPTGNHLGSATDPFVIEGDEYDSAFFDKRSKFIHYAPHIAVLNNLEFDHADIFRDLQDVQRTFIHLSRIVPRRGCVVLNGDDENLKALGVMPWTRVVRVGTGPNNDVRITDFSEDRDGVRFKLEWMGQPWTRVSWKLPGMYNVRNAVMAATAAGIYLHEEKLAASAPVSPVDQLDPRGVNLDCLAHFRGVKRRQEVLVDTPALTVVEDFGHHPTALAETLHSFRNRYPDAVLTAVFEPRSNTARTKTLQSGFMRALALADEVYLGAVNRAEKLKADERFDAEAVAQHIETQGGHAVWAQSNEALFEIMRKELLQQPAPKGRARVVVFFSNGSFDGIIARFAKEARP